MSDSSAKLINYKHVNRDKYNYLAPEDTKRGYYLSKCLYDYDMKGTNMIPYYIQTPRLVTPTGLYMLDDKFYVDVIVPYGSQFLEYLHAEDEKNIRATSEHSGESDWFSTHISIDDVIDQYVSPLVFKGNNENPVLRLEVPMYKRKPVCEVFDINRQNATTDLIKPGTEICGIVSKNGIRFFADKLTGDYTLHKVKVMVDKDNLPKTLPNGYMFDDEDENQEEEDYEDNQEEDDEDNQEEEDEDNQEEEDEDNQEDEEEYFEDDVQELTDDEIDIDISDDEEEDSLDDEEEDSLDEEEEQEEGNEEDKLKEMDDVLNGLEDVTFTPESTSNDTLIVDDLTNIDLDMDGGDVEEESEHNMNDLVNAEELTDDELDIDISDEEDYDEEDNVNLPVDAEELTDDLDNMVEHEESMLLADEPDLLDDSDLEEVHNDTDNLDSLDFGLDLQEVTDDENMKEEIRQDLSNKGAMTAPKSIDEVYELTDADLEL